MISLLAVMADGKSSGDSDGRTRGRRRRDVRAWVLHVALIRAVVQAIPLVAFPV